MSKRRRVDWFLVMAAWGIFCTAVTLIMAAVKVAEYLAERPTYEEIRR